MSDRIRYHIRKSAIRQGIYLLSCWGIFAVWSLLETLGESDFDGIGLLRLYILSGLIEILYSVWNNSRFIRMIRQQEDVSGVPFDDNDALPFSKYSMNSIAGAWFIRSGSYAFYRGCITDVSHKRYRHIRVNGQWLRNLITVKTTYGKRYRFRFNSDADAEKFLEWSRYGVR